MGSARNAEHVSAGSSTLHFMRLDITDKTSVKHFASAVENEFGGVTILVNNAGNILTAGACIFDCIKLDLLSAKQHYSTLFVLHYTTLMSVHCNKVLQLAVYAKVQTLLKACQCSFDGKRAVSVQGKLDVKAAHRLSMTQDCRLCVQG